MLRLVFICFALIVCCATVQNTVFEMKRFDNENLTAETELKNAFENLGFTEEAIKATTLSANEDLPGTSNMVSEQASEIELIESVEANYMKKREQAWAESEVDRFQVLRAAGVPVSLETLNSITVDRREKTMEEERQKFKKAIESSTDDERSRFV